ncbi:protein N-lysine methyltransferase METTL21A-like [Clytia hemisphaerica]|uniref:Uncharacterized protein n=1 Tax=Clytia hemisphaerica TaxID=252671 RepID=A0A7M5X5S2_9CNID
MALILYEPNPLPFLQVFEREERTFTMGDDLPVIKISQDWNKFGVAAVVWEAALILGTYLMTIREDIKGKEILELGSGTGFCGIVSSLLGGNVVMTDLADCLDACHQNTKLNLNHLHNFDVKPLNWEDDHKREWANKHFDYIIGADLVYIEETFQNLVKTFKYFHNINKTVKILLAGKIRYKERFQKFQNILEKDFSIEFLQHDDSSNIYLAKIS